MSLEDSILAVLVLRTIGRYRSCQAFVCGTVTCWNVASSNPSRRNSAMTALRRSCSCTDAHLDTHESHVTSTHTPAPASHHQARLSLDGHDVGGGKHLVQRLHHVTHPHQSCHRGVGGRVLADLRRPAADVQTSARVAGQSGHLRQKRRTVSR